MDCSLSGSSVHRILRQEYWSGLLFPSPGDLPDPGIKPASLASPALQADSLPRQRLGSPWIIYLLLFSGSVMFDCLRPHGLSPTRLLCPWGSPGKNTGVGCHTLPQGVFRTRGSNLGLLCVLHWQAGSFTTSATWEAGSGWRGFKPLQGGRFISGSESRPPP